MSDPWPRACLSCGRVQAWPRPVCDGCAGRGFAASPDPLRGIVYSVTVVHRAPTPEFASDLPYAVMLVRAAAGGLVMGRARGFPIVASIGTPVRVVRAGPALAIVPE